MPNDDLIKPLDDGPISKPELTGSSINNHGVSGSTKDSAHSGVFGINLSREAASASLPSSGPDGNGVKGITHVPNGSGVCGVAHNSEGAGVTGVGKTAGRFLGDVEVTGKLSADHLKINTAEISGIITVASSGDIQLADVAEDFDVVDKNVEAGTVMVLTENGFLKVSDKPYDKKVAGVISGAGNFKPAVILNKKRNAINNRLPIAMVGKVYCKADATFAAIEVGDLLTTSTEPGYAMKAEEPARAFGAVIGKALHSLKEGKGLIPVLIALQ